MPTFSTHFLEKHQFAAYDDVCMKCSGVAVYEVLCITMVRMCIMSRAVTCSKSTRYTECSLFAAKVCTLTVILLFIQHKLYIMCILILYCIFWGMYT